MSTSIIPFAAIPSNARIGSKKTSKNKVLERKTSSLSRAPSRSLKVPPSAEFLPPSVDCEVIEGEFESFFEDDISLSSFLPWELYRKALQLNRILVSHVDIYT